MFEVLIISIGLVLVIEGILYYFLADKIDTLIDMLKSINKQKIKTFGLCAAFVGICLIYFTIKSYGALK